MSVGVLPADVTTSCVETDLDLSNLTPEWRELVRTTGADCFLHPLWISKWWKHFGSKAELCVIVIRHKGELVSVLPFCIRQLGIGPFRTRVARLAGTDPYTVILKLPAKREFLAHAIDESIRVLLDQKKCHAVSFTPVSKHSDLSEVADQTAGERGVAVHRSTNGSHVVFHLPSSFDEYLTALSKKRRAAFRRELRNLSEHYEIGDGVKCPDESDFQAFIRLHTRQWEEEDRGGHFSDWPGSSEFYLDLASDPDSNAFLHLHEISGADGVLASQFMVGSGKIFHWRLPARRMDEEFDKFSLGKLGLILMIKQLISDGVQIIEAGLGEYDYKTSYGGTNVTLDKVIAYPDTPWSRKRLKLLLAWEALLHFVYYRLWFLKMAPRVRKVFAGASKPLWRKWIYSRI